jgi:energy-coupling factor transporter ATP-binding protein EcfA2
MSSTPIKITALPTRYEPLMTTFGEKATTTFVPVDADLSVLKRLIAAAQAAGQGKIIFLSAQSGSGKSTFVHSLGVFLPDQIGSVVRLPAPHELKVADIPGFLSQLPVAEKFTVVNFDGREAPLFNPAEYQTFLGALNGLLRARRDVLVIWPVTDAGFAKQMIEMLEKVGGRSAFGLNALYEMQGLPREKYNLVLSRILQIANWTLDDAAVSETEVQTLIGERDRIGLFLEDLQALIATRFDIGPMGVEFPTLVLVITSSEEKIRDTCRSLRRADSFYIEASRLLMYTKRSNVAEWWGNRATDLKSALPHVIALFNAQLVSSSASAVVHSVLQSGNHDLLASVIGVRADQGNAGRIMQSSELYRFIKGAAVDNREYGSNVKPETLQSYDRIQKQSETHHRDINSAMLSLVDKSLKTEGQDGALSGLTFETGLRPGLQTDATYDAPSGKIALEFHHKAASEATKNKVAIYIMEKLKEYAINFGLAQR